MALPLLREMSAPIDPGVPGRSARRTHARRKANRERRIREKHRVIGGAIVALQSAPHHEHRWARGASGEERVAGILAKHLGSAVVLLHDRRIPRSRANIDHIAVAPSGVWVIDSKRIKGKATVVKPLLGRPKLTIGGRDQTKLVNGVKRQVDLVQAFTDEVAPGVPVRGALCFVDTELPLVRKLAVDEVPLLRPKALAKRINKPSRPQWLGSDVVAQLLAERFPPA